VKPEPEKRRVDRGSGWGAGVSSWLRGADRSGVMPSGRHAALGFRPTLDIPKEKR